MWVATVDNIDWPSRAGPVHGAAASASCIAILDSSSQLHMNAIILQVRPAADALYESTIEPWSEYLTGEMGARRSRSTIRSPSRSTEAHKRGLELHAWINPYRATLLDDEARRRRTHISRTHPELVRTYGPYLWMDPGDPARARAHDARRARCREALRHRWRSHRRLLLSVPGDAARTRRSTSPTTRPTQRYREARRHARARRLAPRRTWTCSSSELYDSIQAREAVGEVRHQPVRHLAPRLSGIVAGFDQYAELYADSRKWLHEGWVDYFTPQLYWADRPAAAELLELLGGGREQNLQGRNLWPGNYTGKVGFTNSHQPGAPTRSSTRSASRARSPARRATCTSA